jgi:hypothetical protein
VRPLKEVLDRVLADDEALREPPRPAPPYVEEPDELPDLALPDLIDDEEEE